MVGIQVYQFAGTFQTTRPAFALFSANCQTHRACQHAEDDPKTAATLLEEASELYRGDFLEGLELGAKPPPELTAFIERLRGGEEL